MINGNNEPIKFPPCASMSSLCSKISPYFNKNILIKAFLVSTLLSSFIYLDHFNFKNIAITSIFGYFGIFLWLQAERKTSFWIGFFIGVFWFWWISISFIYYNIGYLIPLGILIIALIYGFMGLLIGYLENMVLRAVALFLISYLHPLDFDWFFLELVFVNSIFGLTKLHFALLLSSMLVALYLKHWLRIVIVVGLLVASLDNFKSQPTPAPLKIYLDSSYINQKEKWKEEVVFSEVNAKLKLIARLKDEYDLIVLPESAFALFLSKQPRLTQYLKKLSLDATIALGSLHVENKKFYNSTYIFMHGNMMIVNKRYLVPFGEYIPLPRFIRNGINALFYDGASDYSKAKKLNDVVIEGVQFRNAICYEVTKEELYKTDAPYILAISNNGWFTPSIEPTLQRLIITFYAKKYRKIVYHSVNMSKSEVIGE